MASSSLISEMVPDKLGEWLLGEFGSDYHKDIDVFVGAGINGQIFLGLNNDLLEALNVSMRFKQLVLEKVKELTNTSGNGVDSATPGNGSSLSPHILLCTTGDLDLDCSFSDPDSTDTPDDVLRAYVPPNVIWRGKKELAVKFLNDIPDDWTYAGSGMNIGNIMSWAKEWSLRGNGVIPNFILVEEPSARSNIRVKFTTDGRTESKVGNKAKGVKNSEATMWLDLHSKPSDDRYKKHLVIHEFGHALGLGHEHQRSDFWKHIKRFVDLVEMETCLGVGDVYSDRNWGRDKDSKKGICTPDYDPLSVMHYWFSKDWLKDPYSDENKVETDPNLSAKEKAALLGVHKRHHNVADEPSEMDIQLLKKLYGGYGGSRCNIMGPSPPPKKACLENIDTDEQEKISVEKDGGLPQFPQIPPPDLEAARYVSVTPPDDSDSERLPDDPIWETKPTPGYLQLLKWYDGDNKIQYLRLFQELISHWRRAAETLHISNAVINYIAEEKMSERIRKVIGKWLDNGSRLPQAKLYPVSWRGFYDLLCDMEKTELATTLKCAMSAKRSNIRNTFR